MGDLVVTMQVDNLDLYKKLYPKALEKGLEAIGMKAEGYAKAKCPVDTGLLRNSITYAVSGKAISYSYKANMNKGYDDVEDKAKSGSVSGVMGTSENPAVYIGTNVEYAPYVEMGTINYPTPRPFIKPAAANHAREYKAILEEALKNG